jgi:cell division septal protein FtsQ
MKKYRRPLRVKRNNFLFKQKTFWFIVFSISAILVSFFLFFFVFFQTKEIIVKGENILNGREIQEEIKENLERKLLFLKTKNIFLIDKKEIEEKIKRRFNMISKAKISLKLPQTIEVYVEERIPVAIVCNEICYFLDKEGVVFANKDQETSNFLKIFLKGKEVLKIQDKIEKKILDSIFEFKDKLKEEFNIEVEKVEFFSPEKLIFFTNEGWQIIVNITDDLNWQFVKLRVLLEREIPADRRKNLDYVELRFDNLAPFKYKN